MDIDQIVASLEQADTKPKWEPEKTFEELGTEYPFSDAKDAVGIPLEDKAYVKRSCKNCNGRGGVIMTPAKQSGRRWVACGCLRKGYVRARHAFDLRMAQIKKLVEQAQKNDEAVAAIVEQRSEEQPK